MRSSGGRSLFQSLTMTARPALIVDAIETRTESSGAGFTVHGVFLFAEEIDGDQEIGDNWPQARRSRYFSEPSCTYTRNLAAR